MYTKTICPECGNVKYINIKIEVYVGNTRPVIEKALVSDIITEDDFVDRIIRNISPAEKLEDIKRVVRDGFNVSPQDVNSLALNVFKKLATMQLPPVKVASMI